MSLIEIQDVKKVYEVGDTQVNALDGVSLRIEEREFTAIVGPSGSGKSTLMNIIGCLDTPSAGTYRLGGRNTGSCSDAQLSEVRNRQIGFIFQKFNLLGKLTALENVELPLIYQGVGGSERRRRAAAALKAMGLESRMNHRPTELSGGQQQRVAIARALITNPPLILADEPTGNLDSRTGKEVIGILQDLHTAGNTIVLITHDMSVAKQARRMVRIMDGAILADEEVKAG